MKCPHCWADKAYLRPVRGWKDFVLHCLLLRPLQCRHCYHKFIVPWILTIGKKIAPPPSRSAAPAGANQLSYAARHCGTIQATIVQSCDDPAVYLRQNVESPALVRPKT